MQELLDDTAAWDAFVAASDTPTHLQVSAWARVKAANGWRSFRVVADGGSGPIGGQVLVRRLGPGPFGLGYLPRGPIATRFDAASLAAFTDALRRAARRRRLTHVTIEPGLEESDERLAVLEQAGYLRTDPVQPDSTRLIDLTRAEEQLLADLRQTTRWSARRAGRDGVTVRSGGEELFETWFDLLAQTAQRSGFIRRGETSYRAAFDAFAPPGDAWIMVAYLPSGEPGAATMLFRCDGTVTEMYSGMSLTGAKALANFALHWEAIRQSRLAGATVYDMWGLAHAGIALFKAGFGGREVHYVGSWDLVTLPLLRDAVIRLRHGYIRLVQLRKPKSTRAEPTQP